MHLHRYDKHRREGSLEEFRLLTAPPAPDIEAPQVEAEVRPPAEMMGDLGELDNVAPRRSEENSEDDHIHSDEEAEEAADAARRVP